ncbi:conserved protein, unknown function [Hepatocystis sp. ex Piliocolobus tephrosceles]|nr:conserved protein, unknown function [Hepatocystis sp. ex Piliocolobus tephrosceles]
MLYVANKLNKKRIYKLFLENDKLISMPMFLTDSLYMRNKEELILLLNNAITFDKQKFLYNYKKILLKNDGHIGLKQLDIDSEIKKNREEIVRYCKLDIHKNMLGDSTIPSGNATPSDIILTSDNTSTSKHKDSCTDLLLNKNDNIQTYADREYKYNNDEYDNIIYYLSQIHADENMFDLSGFNMYKEENIYEIEYEDDDAYNEYVHNRKEQIEIDDNIIHKTNITEDYMLTGYFPNRYFFFCFKNRVLTIKKQLSLNNLCSFIYLYNKIENIEMVRILGEEYINRYKMEKDKIINHKHIIHLLNIYIKIKYKRNNVDPIIEFLVKQLYQDVSLYDLKLATLGFVCLSKLNLFNILFYNYIGLFLTDINTGRSSFSPFYFSLILHCIGYYRHDLLIKKKKLLHTMRLIKGSHIYDTFNGTEDEEKNYANKNVEIVNKIKRGGRQKKTYIEKYNSNNNHKEGDTKVVLPSLEEKKKKKMALNQEKTKKINVRNYVLENIKINGFTFLLHKNNSQKINELEKKIISRLADDLLENICERSISCIFHHYFLTNKRILNITDKILIEKLLNVLIKKNICFVKPRYFLMCCYTLIIYRYFTNIDVAFYFLKNCTKLICKLKQKVYIDNFLFVLTGFVQNRSLFCKKINNTSNGYNTTDNNDNRDSDTYPTIYINNKTNDMANLKIGNKHFDEITNEITSYGLVEEQKNDKKKNTQTMNARLAILYIFNEIINLDYDLNVKQILLYIQLFASYNIKLNSEIKKKICYLISNNVYYLVSSVNLVLQLSIKIFEINSDYFKNIATTFLDKMNCELMQFTNILMNNSKQYFFDCIVEGVGDGINYNTSNNNTNMRYTYLTDIDTLGNILFIFDQIDLNKKEFILNIINLLSIHNYLLLKYKKIKFNSFVYILHYICSSYIDTQEYVKLVGYIMSNIRVYIDLCYRQYMQTVGKKMDVRVVNREKDSCTVSHGNNTSTNNSSISNNSDGNSEEVCTAEEYAFDQVNHDIIKDKIYIKDIIIFLDFMRISKLYINDMVLGTLIEMMKTNKIKSLSNEDIELLNYIFIDMGMFNKNVMDEAKYRGLSIGLNS